jgi:hypothetical protein
MARAAAVATVTAEKGTEPICGGADQRPAQELAGRRLDRQQRKDAIGDIAVTWSAHGEQC